MQGDVMLATTVPEAHRPLIQRLGAQGYCVLPVRSVPEAFAALNNGAEGIRAAIFDMVLRRKSDYESLAVCLDRHPVLQIVVAAGPAGHDSDLRGHSKRLHRLAGPLTDAQSLRRIDEVLAEAGRAEELAGAAAASQLDGGLRSEELLHYPEEFLARVGQANVPVLLQGETGVGKEVMARRLWSYSPRADKPFLKLNCAALPSELIESELFGYEKGAFTGAASDKVGRFEMAQDGTILLDEIGDMDIRLQAKLLQVLQDGEIQPLGSHRIVKVNVRIMAATHRDLRRAIEEGSFREDLYYRLNVVSITIPPLRERRNEIAQLARVLLERHLPEGAKAPEITPALRQAMLAYPWPGNVRELENVMRRFLVYQEASMLIRELDAATETPRPGLAAADGTGQERAVEIAEVRTIDRLAEVSRAAESRLLLDALEATRWNRRQAAAKLDMDYKAFLYKLQKHGIAESKARRRLAGA